MMHTLLVNRGRELISEKRHWLVFSHHDIFPLWIFNATLTDIHEIYWNIVKYLVRTLKDGQRRFIQLMIVVIKISSLII